MKILDFDLEGNHFIIEADISLRQKADDNMKSQDVYKRQGLRQ